MKLKRKLAEISVALFLVTFKNRQSEMRRALNKTCNKTISAAFDKQWGGVVKKCPPG